MYLYGVQNVTDVHLKHLPPLFPGRVAPCPGPPWREEPSARVPGASLDATLAAARCAGRAELAGVGRRHAPWGHVGIPVGEFAHALGAGSPVRCRAHFPLGRWPWKGGAGSKIPLAGQAFPPLSLLRVSRCAASWSGGLPDPVSRSGWLLNSHPCGVLSPAADPCPQRTAARSLRVSGAT